MNVFIGRESELRQSLEQLGSPNSGVVHEVVGVHGIGKSCFLDRMTEEAQRSGARTFALDMKRFGLGEGFTKDLGEKASPAVLWETFTRSRQLMRLFADMPEREFDTFRQVARMQSQKADRYLAKNDVTLGRRSQVGQATFVTNISEDSVKQHIREVQNEVDEAFIAAWTEFTIRRRVLITIEAFELVADDEMGQWIVRTANRMPNTLTLVAHAPAAEATPLPQTRKVHLPLFTPQEVADLLGARLHTDSVDPEIVEIAHGFTDGHPGGVSLIADLILETGGPGLSAATLRRMLDRLPPEPSQRWAELVRLILDAVHEPVLRKAVDAIALTSTFDASLLGELITSGDDDVNVGDAIRRLEGLRLLQPVKALSGDLSSRFRLHEFIRQSVAGRLRTYSPQEWLEIHRRAAQYYFRLLRGWEDAPYDSYGGWYRFESPEWQENKREWLHHSGMLTDDRTMTRARFTLVFLGAFWWWGYYVPFPFNRRLLEDWSRACAVWERAYPAALDSTVAAGDQLLHDALTVLLNEYPVSHFAKPRGAKWDLIRDKLLLIRRLCGLHAKRGRKTSPEESEERLRTDAFITLFLAHTRRFRDPADPKADEYYATAARQFSALRDAWNESWTAYERADLAVERADVPTAAGYLVTAAAVSRKLVVGNEEWDHELAGNIHRTLADVHWIEGEWEKAGREYGRAVAHAYWFQGDPHAPDEYTQQFYLELTSRSAERVLATRARDWTGDPADARAFLSALSAELPNAPSRSPGEIETSGNGTGGLRDQLFLAGPQENELRADDSAFLNTWQRLCEDPSPMLHWLVELENVAVAVRNRRVIES
jgi:hypothetical protein